MTKETVSAATREEIEALVQALLKTMRQVAYQVASQTGDTEFSRKEKEERLRTALIALFPTDALGRPIDAKSTQSTRNRRECLRWRS